MGVTRDDVVCEPVAGRAELRETVAQEVRRLLESVAEVDLATVYRTMVGLMGAHVVPHIAEAISAGLRRGEIEMEPRITRPDAPAVAYVRRAGIH